MTHAIASNSILRASSPLHIYIPVTLIRRHANNYGKLCWIENVVYTYLELALTLMITISYFLNTGSTHILPLYVNEVLRA